MPSPWFTKVPLLVAVGVLVSLLLSAWAIHIDGIINNDGVHYIVTAERLADGRWQDALKAFKWPGYPLLIAALAGLPGIGFETAAYAVTAAGFALAVIAFVAVIRALGGSGRVLWLGLLTILVYPGFNEIRSYLVRDPFYLAFYLLGLAALLRYLADGGLRPILAGTGCLLAAALFRVEALAFAVLIPVLPALRGGRRGFAPAAVYFMVVFPLLWLVYAWWSYRPDGFVSPWAVLEHPGAVVGGALQQLFGEFSARLAALADSGAAAPELMLAGRAAWLVLRETVEAITVPFALILLFELLRRRLTTSWSAPATRLLLAFMAINLVVLVTFALARFFVAPRYPLALAVTVILAVPFALDRYLDTLRRWPAAGRRRLVAGLLALLLGINLVEGLDNFTDKHYLRRGGEWLTRNAEPGYRLGTNDLRLAYYAGEHGRKWVAMPEEAEFHEFIVERHWKRKDYVAVNLRRKDPELALLVSRVLNQRPVREFVSDKGDRLLIYYTGDE